MAKSFDCIVIGCGGFGSGAMYHAAKMGASVLGIERFSAAHDLGSSHGESRIIRKAYFEHPDYVPLLHDAFELWRTLEAETNQTLMHECGLFLAGPADGQAIVGAKLAAEEHDLAIQSISANEVSPQTMPGFLIPDGCEVVVEPEAGFLLVEQCVAAHLQQAQQMGATLRTGETVVGWKSNGSTVTVTTDQAEYSAASVIISAGAWSKQVLNDLSVPLQVVRKLMFWHDCEHSTASAHHLVNSGKVFFFEMPYGEFYGVPSIDGRTIKVARHTGGIEVTDPSAVDRGLHEDDHTLVAKFVAECMPTVQPQPVSHSVCMYTFTPDGHFIVDQHPNYSNVTIAAGFSGHGFKFTSVLGRTLAELSLRGSTGSPVRFLGFDRLEKQS